ncbi:keratin, type I cytoskeletal 9-like [Penaeus monodon]|uniref:keratin, type I cytoskeletal 9-like n=1 Tax=Penaeus monodon TaxID=6687 RepID=UPI0018A7B2B4|nr:keratin, type I cytoskeletal 9-like [Penaeus monodon]
MTACRLPSSNGGLGPPPFYSPVVNPSSVVPLRRPTSGGLMHLKEKSKPPKITEHPPAETADHVTLTSGTYFGENIGCCRAGSLARRSSGQVMRRESGGGGGGDSGYGGGGDSGYGGGGDSGYGGGSCDGFSGNEGGGTGILGSGGGGGNDIGCSGGSGSSGGGARERLEMRESNGFLCGQVTLSDFILRILWPKFL